MSFGSPIPLMSLLIPVLVHRSSGILCTVTHIGTIDGSIFSKHSPGTHLSKNTGMLFTIHGPFSNTSFNPFSLLNLK
ncbi:hypothetical protein Hanom_Chr13g01182351 [Helianthus anomalus]